MYLSFNRFDIKKEESSVLTVHCAFRLARNSDEFSLTLSCHIIINIFKAASFFLKLNPFHSCLKTLTKKMEEQRIKRRKKRHKRFGSSSFCSHWESKQQSQENQSKRQKLREKEKKRFSQKQKKKTFVARK